MTQKNLPYKDNVKLEDIWVTSHDRLSDFYVLSWQRGESPVPMLAVRLILASMAVSILSWSLAEQNQTFWWIYLTHWGILLLTLTMLSALLVSILAVCGKIKEDTPMPWYVSMYWLLFNQGVCIAIMITALYWILLFNDEYHDNARAFWMDVSTHAFNSFIALLELVASRTPVRFLHIYQPLGFGLWYTAFTAIYYAAGGTGSKGEPYIYEVLDWRNGRRTGTIVALCIAGVLAVYTILWAIAQVRDWVAIRLVRTKSHDLPPSPPDNLSHARIV